MGEIYSKCIKLANHLVGNMIRMFFLLLSKVLPAIADAYIVNTNGSLAGGLAQLSVTELKRLLQERGIDFRDCLEKKDLVERLSQSLANPKNPVQAKKNLPKPLDVGSSEGLQVGQAVLEIGNPDGLDTTPTTGVVSALGREVDPRREVELYQEAHEKGLVSATYNLAVCYLEGNGVEANPRRAIHLFKQAYEEGHVKATYNLGVCYIEGNGVEANPRRAIDFFIEAHEAGHAKATYNLGVCHENGIGVEVDPPLAVELYRQAHEYGDIVATCKLACCYLVGIGVEMDPLQAFLLYLHAHNNGSVAATFRLGIFYENGIGVQRNPRLAAELFQQGYQMQQPWMWRATH